MSDAPTPEVPTPNPAAAAGAPLWARVAAAGLAGFLGLSCFVVMVERDQAALNASELARSALVLCSRDAREATAAGFDCATAQTIATQPTTPTPQPDRGLR